MFTDAELLRRYAEVRDERAFTDLVQRHLNLVYDAALRRTCGRAHVAEEIAQKVFTDLARKAVALQHHPTLAGWLHRSTRYAAIDAARREIRGQKLVRSLAVMTNETPPPEPHSDWENLRPVIDEAMDNLKEADREIVLLRYFDGLSFAAVGKRMNLSENTARMRATRSLDKLRTQLGKRGLTSTASALGVLLANQALATAPAGLAANVTAAAMAAAPVGALASLWAILALNKAAAVWIGAGLAVGFTGIGWSLSEARASQNALAVLQAEHSRLSVTLVALRHQPAIDPVTPKVITLAMSAAHADRATTEAQAEVKGKHSDHGQATAEDTLLSYAWALDTGNAAALGNLITFDEAGRKELEGLYARTPESIRTRYRTPLDLFVHAQLVSAVLKPPTGVEQIEQYVATEVSPGHVVLRKAGSTGKGWPMVQTAAGWKIQFPSRPLSDAGLLRLLNNELVVKLGLN